MAGYPLVVVQFYQINVNTIVFLDGTRVGSLAHDGVLLHLAIAVDDMEMFERLYRLALVSPERRTDQNLSRAKVMRCAVLYDSVGALQSIAKLTPDDAKHPLNLTPNLLRIALRCVNPDVRLLEWLHTNLLLQGNCCPIVPSDLLSHTRKGDFAVVHWLHKHNALISQEVVNEAAKWHHLEMLQYFYAHSTKRCGRVAVEAAAARGYLGILECIIAHQIQDMRPFAINSAMHHGQLEIVKLFMERSKPSKLELLNVIDQAAAGGHLDVVMYLHEHHFKDGGGCTSQAMRDAAAQGHLEVIQFLFENRTEGCTPDALSLAAWHGHLEIVQFLHEKFALCCLTDAMDQAAERGHLEIVK